MSTTVLDILSDALVEAGVLSVGAAPSAEDAQFALRTLNRMMSVWGIDYGMVDGVDRAEYSLVSGQQKYTIGVGGNFNTVRPSRVEMASVLLAGGEEIPVDIISDEDWRDVSMKATASTFPAQVYFTDSGAFLDAYFWPVPSDSSVKVVLYTWAKTNAFTSLNTVTTFPDGYEEAIVTNLAVHLCSSYGLQPSLVLAERAGRSKSTVRSINAEAPRIYCDAGVTKSNRNSTAVKTFGIVVD